MIFARGGFRCFCRTILVTIRSVSIWLPRQEAARQFNLSGFAERTDMSVLESFARAGELATSLYCNPQDRCPSPPALALSARLNWGYLRLLSKVPVFQRWMVLWTG